MLATTTALSLHALSAAPHHLKIQKQRRETPPQCSTNRSKTTSTTQAPLWRPYTPRPPPPTAARSARSCGLLSQLQAVFLRMPATRTPSNSPPYLIQFVCPCGNTTAAPSARAQASEQGQRARAQKAPVTKGGLGYGSAFPLRLLVLTRLVVRVLRCGGADWCGLVLGRVESWVRALGFPPFSLSPDPRAPPGFTRHARGA